MSGVYQRSAAYLDLHKACVQTLILQNCCSYLIQQANTVKLASFVSYCFLLPCKSAISKHCNLADIHGVVCMHTHSHQYTHAYKHAHMYACTYALITHSTLSYTHTHSHRHMPIEPYASHPQTNLFANDLNPTQKVTV